MNTFPYQTFTTLQMLLEFGHLGYLQNFKYSEYIIRFEIKVELLFLKTFPFLPPHKAKFTGHASHGQQSHPRSSPQL